MGVALACIVARFRDARHIVDVLFQLWFWATPIIYPIEQVRPDWRGIFALNPFTPFLAGIQGAFADGEVPGPGTWLACLALALASAAAGLAVYRLRERKVAYGL
jgi:ABC-type polysaccharide/polyol phosphate export permease